MTNPGHDIPAPTSRYVERIAQTSHIGLAMEAVLNATDELRRRLEQRGRDADKILAPLEKGLDATWEQIG